MPATSTDPAGRPGGNDKQMVQGWFVGWKAISGYLDVSTKTAKTYYKKYRMPVLRTPTGKPVCKPDDLDLWLEKFKTKKNRK
jgi:hypothetical protein